MLPVKRGISVCFHPFLVVKTSFNDADIKGALWNVSVVLNTTNKKGLLQVHFYRLFRRAALTLDFYFYKCYHDLLFFFFYVLALSESVEIMPSACIFHLCWHFWASAFWAVAAQLPANNSSQGGRAGRYKKKSSNRVPDRKHTSIWYHRGGGQLPVLCLQMRVILPLSKRYGCQTIKLMLNSSKAVFSVCSVTYYWVKRNIWALHCNKKWINETMSMFFLGGGGM